MAQKNANPNATVNKTGYTGNNVDITLTATSSGLRVQKPVTSGARVIYVALSTVTGNAVCHGWKLRRNTAASGCISLVNGDSTPSGQYWGDAQTIGPVGSFVNYPQFTIPKGTASLTQLIIHLDDRICDFTLTGLNVYDAGTAPADTVALDASDADFTYIRADNSLTVTYQHANTNDEQVGRIDWDWGAGGSTVTQHNFEPAAASPSLVKTYTTAGIYNVSCTVFDGNGATYTHTKAVSVPSGTFTADFSYETQYQTVNVDASSSIAPELAPIDTYRWYWGDGTFTTASIGNKFASKTYTNPGTYNVTLEIKTTSVNRTAQKIKTVTVVAAPSPTNYFTTSHKLLEVAFTPSIQDGTSYSWNFGDGTTSAVKNETHTYGAPGTYTVVLTVNGTLTATQTVLVTDVYTPIGSLGEALRLEVAVPHPTGTIYNRLPNPSGEQGAYGWSTPVANSLIKSFNGDLHGNSGPRLIYQASGTGAQTWYSTAVAASAGQYAGAQLVVAYTGTGYLRFAVEALNAAGTVLGTSSTTGYFQASSSVVRTTGYLLPTGTAFTRLKMMFTSDAGTGVPAANATVEWRRAMLGLATTSAALSTNTYIEGFNWQDLLGPTSTITFSREELNVGTFSCRVLDSIFDPATSGTIRPGQGLRLRVAIADSFGNIHYENAFTGRVRKATTDYKPLTDRPVIISLEATDNTTELAATSQPEGVETVAELPALLEAAPVPYEINNSTAQVTTADVIAVNDNASLLDQIAITRDVASGLAFVDRNNVLKVHDPSAMSSTPIAIIDETVYYANGVQANFNTERCINYVMIKWLRFIPAAGDEPAKVEEVYYGPYKDQASIDQWGLCPGEFVMQGANEVSSAINAKGAAILLANKTPLKMIESVTLPIRYAEDLTLNKALLDIGDVVTLNYDATATNQTARVTGVKHSITPQRWDMTLTFAAINTVAPPQVVASPPPVASGGGTVAAAAYAMARINASTSVPNAAWTTFTAWTDMEKTGFTYASGVWTAASAGLYRIHFTVSFANNSTGIRGIRPTINGVADLNVLANPTVGFQTTMDVSIIKRLEDGDTVACQLYQNSTAALNALGDTVGVYSKTDLQRVGD